MNNLARVQCHFSLKERCFDAPVASSASTLALSPIQWARKADANTLKSLQAVCVFIFCSAGPKSVYACRSCRYPHLKILQLSWKFAGDYSNSDSCKEMKVDLFVDHDDRMAPASYVDVSKRTALRLVCHNSAGRHYSRFFSGLQFALSLSDSWMIANTVSRVSKK